MTNKIKTLIKNNICVNIAAVSFICMTNSQAKVVEFNPDFIVSGSDKPIDLESFNDGKNQLTGNVNADTYINEIAVGMLFFKILSKDGHQIYLIKKTDVEKLGLEKKYKKEILDSNELDFVEIPFANVKFDSHTLVMSLTIPQIYMSRDDIDYVEPAFADKGITAAFVDYSSSFDNNNSNSENEKQLFSSLSTGVNINGWYFRHNGNYSYINSEHEHDQDYTAVNTYVKKDIGEINSSLIIGQYYTLPNIFDSFAFSGAMLATDDKMLPDSKLGYAPIVRGVANSNAIVTVKQASNIIYQANVPPGPFVFDNIYGSGYAGDLNIEIKEVTGEIRKFVVPYSNVPQLLREDVAKYNFTVGKYRQEGLTEQPHFAQFTYQRGLTSSSSYYGGSLFSKHYISFIVGAAYATKIGGFAVDVTSSNINSEKTDASHDNNTKGQSYRLSYSKALESTGTNLSFAGYKFSSKGYSKFSDFADREYSKYSNNTVRYSTKNKFQVTVNQTISDSLGSLFLSGSVQDYWTSQLGRDSTYQGGYNNSFSWGGLSLSSSRTISNAGKTENQYMVSITIPFGNGMHSPYLSSSYTTSDSGHNSFQNSLSGTLGKTNEFSYGLFSSLDENSSHYEHNYGGNVQLRTSNAALSSNFSRGRNYSQFSVGASGSLLVFSDGLLMGPDQGETKTIIYADKAAGAESLNSSGTRINKNGFALLSGLRPYRKNDISLNTGGMSDSVELLNTDKMVAPAYGSVVRVNFDTNYGRPYIFNLNIDNDKDLPLGADVIDSKGKIVTQVGQGSRVYLRIKDKISKYIVRWGLRTSNQCTFTVQISDEDLNGDSLKMQNLICR
ncbi:fimbria/pilus outer membrane usher protein [Klebsiella aerogenes]